MKAKNYSIESGTGQCLALFVQCIAKTAREGGLNVITARCQGKISPYITYRLTKTTMKLYLSRGQEKQYIAEIYR